MFSDKTMYESIALATELTNRGISLKSQSETPLYDLMTASYPTGSIFENERKLLDAIEEATKVKSLDDTEVHFNFLTKFAWGLSESLNSTMSIARNEINPMIKEVMAEISQTLDNGLIKDTGILITPVFQPEILKSGDLDGLIERYVNNDYQEVRWQSSDKWPILDIETLKNSAKGISRDIDSQIDQLLEQLGDEIISDIYNRVFKYTTPLESYKEVNIVHIEIYMQILPFLWASNWLIEPPDGVNINLAELTMSLTNLKSNSAKAINAYNVKFDRMSSQNNFIIKLPNLKVADPIFLVQGEIYNNWIDNGGSPELLIGSFLTDKSINLLNITEDLEKEYLRKYRLESDVRRQEYNIKKETVVTKVLSDFIDEKIITLAADRTIIRQRFNEKVAKFPYRDSMGLSQWVRKIICHVFYPNSEALAILMSIDSILASNPNMEPREAATASAINLVSDWLYSVVTVDLVS